MAAIDTLSAHLHTTFNALSSAFAQRDDAQKQSNSHISVARAHMMFVVGPSIGTARAKVGLILDGLEISLWGQRSTLASQDGQGQQHYYHDVNVPQMLDLGDENEEEAISDESDIESVDVLADSVNEMDLVDSALQQPPSRSPSPSSSLSTTSSPSPSRSTAPISNIENLRGRRPLSQTHHPHKSNARYMPPPKRTYAEEQELIRAAERLLSRTLAEACAEEGDSILDELCKHVLQICRQGRELIVFDCSYVADTHSSQSTSPICPFCLDTSPESDTIFGEHVIDSRRRCNA